MQHHVFHRNLHYDYPVVEKGEGVYVFDTTGKRYIDGCSSALVNNIGHGVMEVAASMTAQAAKMAFMHMSQFSNQPIAELAELVAEMAPKEINRVYFVSGGSEATEAAIKMARQYHWEKGNVSKYKVISRWQSFHGNSLGAVSIGGSTARRRKFSPILVEFPHIPPAYCYRCYYDKEYPSCQLTCAAMLEKTILQEGPENISAFILEPIIGSSAAAVVPPPEYFAQIREICDKYDVLLIADEVMTGFGRTGENFAVDHWQVTPDIICVAKGMSAGYTPLGALLVRDKVYEAFNAGTGRFTHGHTYAGNPVSGAIGSEVLKYIEKYDLVAAAKKQGECLLNKLQDLSDLPIVGDVRGKGLMLGVELVQEKTFKKPFAAEVSATDRVKEKAFEKGLIIYPAKGCIDGSSGDSLLLAPPLTITNPQIDEIVAIIKDTLSEFMNEL